jgi:hypothetical protein
LGVNTPEIISASSLTAPIPDRHCSGSHPGQDKLEHSAPDSVILRSLFSVPCSLFPVPCFLFPAPRSLLPALYPSASDHCLQTNSGFADRYNNFTGLLGVNVYLLRESTWRSTCCAGSSVMRTGDTFWKARVGFFLQ